jgi:hypothetical protein
MDSAAICASCKVGKAKLQPFPLKEGPSIQLLELVLVDLLTGGVTSLDGHDYAIVISNNATKFHCICIIFGLKPIYPQKNSGYMG